MKFIAMVTMLLSLVAPVHADKLLGKSETIKYLQDMANNHGIKDSIDWSLTYSFDDCSITRNNISGDDMSWYKQTIKLIDLDNISSRVYDNGINTNCIQLMSIGDKVKIERPTNAQMAKDLYICLDSFEVAQKMFQGIKHLTNLCGPKQDFIDPFE